MRMHITRLLAIAAAASTIGGTALATAGAASAATGPTIGTRVAAGYQDSGRDFRYIASTITIPDQVSFQGLYPQEYVELSNGSALTGLGTNSGDQYARAGVETCTVALHDSATPINGATCNQFTSPWVAFVDTFNNSLNGPFTEKYFTLGGGVHAGDGVNVSIYLNQVGNELQFTITPPTPAGGTPVPGETYKTNAYGAIFDHAAALDDFTSSLGGKPVSLPPFVGSFQLNSFGQGAVTTLKGNRGSFTGPWTTSAVEATSNGDLPPLGTVLVNPDTLSSDGLSANGAVRASDFFNVWAK